MARKKVKKLKPTRLAKGLSGRYDADLAKAADSLTKLFNDPSQTDQALEVLRRYVVELDQLKPGADMTLPGPVAKALQNLEADNPARKQELLAAISDTDDSVVQQSLSGTKPREVDELFQTLENKDLTELDMTAEAKRTLDEKKTLDDAAARAKLRDESLLKQRASELGVPQEQIPEDAQTFADLIQQYQDKWNEGTTKGVRGDVSKDLSWASDRRPIDSGTGAREASKETQFQKLIGQEQYQALRSIAHKAEVEALGPEDARKIEDINIIDATEPHIIAAMERTVLPRNMASATPIQGAPDTRGRPANVSKESYPSPAALGSHPATVAKIDERIEDTITRPVDFSGLSDAVPPRNPILSTPAVQEEMLGRPYSPEAGQVVGISSREAFTPLQGLSDAADEFRRMQAGTQVTETPEMAKARIEAADADARRGMLSQLTDAKVDAERRQAARARFGRLRPQGDDEVLKVGTASGRVVPGRSQMPGDRGQGIYSYKRTEDGQTFPSKSIEGAMEESVTSEADRLYKALHNYRMQLMPDTVPALGQVEGRAKDVAEAVGEDSIKRAMSDPTDIDSSILFPLDKFVPDWRSKVPVMREGALSFEDYAPSGDAIARLVAVRTKHPDVEGFVRENRGLFTHAIKQQAGTPPSTKDAIKASKLLGVPNFNPTAGGGGAGYKFFSDPIGEAVSQGMVDPSVRMAAPDDAVTTMGRELPASVEQREIKKVSQSVSEDDFFDDVESTTASPTGGGEFDDVSDEEIMKALYDQGIPFDDPEDLDDLTKNTRQPLAQPRRSLANRQPTLQGLLT